MSQLSQPFACDVCGVIKGAQNHWFRVWRDENAVYITGWGNYAPNKSMLLLTPADFHYHCCGEEHALRKAAELLASLGQAAVPSMEPPPVIAAPAIEESGADPFCEVCRHFRSCCTCEPK